MFSEQKVQFKKLFKITLSCSTLLHCISIITICVTLFCFITCLHCTFWNTLSKKITISCAWFIGKKRVPGLTLLFAHALSLQERFHWYLITKVSYFHCRKTLFYKLTLSSCCDLHFKLPWNTSHKEKQKNSGLPNTKDVSELELWYLIVWKQRCLHGCMSGF